MSKDYNTVLKNLQRQPQTWLVTGVAGFIGSNLLETLLGLDQSVIGLDNFATGHQRNLDEVQRLVGEQRWSRFSFVKGDIRDAETCLEAARGVDYILHQAALGSVPRSIEDPLTTNAVNIDGFLNMLVAAREAKVQRFVYAASSSTYGDHPALPKVEDHIGKPLSPYAVTKYVNELYADVFARTYGVKSAGLRYFNIFGRRQDPDGAYAAVIPKWISAMIGEEDVYVNGDGETSRDFCYIDNAVQANVLAAVSDVSMDASVYNIAYGGQATLNQLFIWLREELEERDIKIAREAQYRDFRAGDVRHSKADISRARDMLNYDPQFSAIDGIREAMPWYIDFLSKQQGRGA